ncbi:MAG TPA: pyridoxamine 5'-phosphate oxidase family protein [Acidimicrobiia bacterium]
MELTRTQEEFIEMNPSAAMITIGEDGFAKAVRVGIAVIDGEVWSSGTAERVRTDRLREDPRCTLFVFGPGYEALTLEGHISLIEGSEAVDESVQLFRQMQDRPQGSLSWYGEELDEDRFRQTMVDQQRLIYVLDVMRAYGVE